MAAGITHMLLVKTFNQQSMTSNEDLKALLDEKIKFVQLGALAPDLAYSQALPIKKWFTEEEKNADKFHYVNTNQIPLKAMERIKKIQDPEDRDNKFCFFLGYISHLIADGIIHPFVRDKVGDYNDAPTEHRELEMKLDAIFLHYVSSQNGRGMNINFAGLQDQIKDVPEDKLKPIAVLFKDLIYDVYGIEATAEEIMDWVDDLEKLFQAAANKNYRWYSWIPGTGSVLYGVIDELLKDKDQYLVLKNNEAVNRSQSFLGKDVHFIDDCVAQFYKVFSSVAEAAYEYIYNDGKKLDEHILQAINFDTGRTLADGSRGKNLDQPAVYWEV